MIIAAGLHLAHAAPSPLCLILSEHHYTTYLHIITIILCVYRKTVHTVIVSIAVANQRRGPSKHDDHRQPASGSTV